MSVKRNITRTFNLVMVNINFVDLFDMTMHEIEIPIPDKFANSEKQLENKCQSYLSKLGNYRFVNIISKQNARKTYSMDEDLFLIQADEIEKEN